MKKKILLIPLALLLAISLVAIGCPTTPTPPPPPPPPTDGEPPPPPPPPPKTLKIGSVWGLTGVGSEIQVIMRMGETLCKDWINAKGGITVNGQQYLIELITEDIKNTAEGCVTGANKLVFQDEVKFIIGLTAPFLVDAVKSVTEPNKVLYMSSQYDNPSPDHPYTLGSYPPYATPKPIEYDYLQAAYPGVKKVAFTIIDEPSCLRAADVAREELEKRGLEEVGAEIYPIGTPDFYPIWTKLLTYEPDAVDINMEWPGGAAANAKAGRELGFTGPIIGNSPWDPVFVADAMGRELATDFFFPTFPPLSPGAPIPPVMGEAMKLWGDTYKEIPFIVDAMKGWDALYCLVQAIEAAQSLEPGDVVKAFENMQTIEHSYGTAKIGGLQTYGVNHVVVAPCPLSRLKDGEVEFIGWYELDIP